jgi:glutathione S-transferase
VIYQTNQQINNNSLTIMPKLYYTATSCGAASFIAAFTAEIGLEAEQVNIQTHQTASGADFFSINTKGNIPALVLDDGKTVLNENIAVLQYIADLKPNSIAPENGTVERAVLQNLLAYFATEVHPSIGGLFNPSLGDETREFIRGNAAKKLSYLETRVLNSDQPQFLQSGKFTIADSYLYIILSWTKYVQIDLSAYPKVFAYFEFIGSLPNVKAAHDRIATSPSTTF